MPYSETPYTIEDVAGNQQFPVNDLDAVALLESALTHPSHGDGLVDKGDPVICGAVCGVAGKSAAVNTDRIPIYRKGIYSLTVLAQDGQGNSNVVIGDVLYLNESTCVVSKIATGRPFGIALHAMTGSATPGILPVFVEADLIASLLVSILSRIDALENHN